MAMNPTKIIKNMVVDATKDTKELFGQINKKIDNIEDKLDNLNKKILYNRLLIKEILNKKDDDEEDEILTENGF